MFTIASVFSFLDSHVGRCTDRGTDILHKTSQNYKFRKLMMTFHFAERWELWGVGDSGHQVLTISVCMVQTSTFPEVSVPYTAAENIFKGLILLACIFWACQCTPR